jgi:hypothetical protein
MSKWGFKNLIKHVFLHDNFLYMWPTSKVKFFEPNAHKKPLKWVNKNHPLVAPASKF